MGWAQRLRGEDRSRPRGRLSDADRLEPVREGRCLSHRRRSPPRIAHHSLGAGIGRFIAFGDRARPFRTAAFLNSERLLSSSGVSAAARVEFVWRRTTILGSMIITIDGPAGSGKSTAARKLAARLEIAYLDTGAMYRAIAYQALQDGVDFQDADTLTALARRTDLQLDCGPTHTRVKVNGHDVSEAIRSMEISRYTSPVASTPAIREMMVAKQRAIGSQLGSLVSEGRDQGSVVFPDADVKFVMDAALEKRAQRRHQELQADGEDVEYPAVLENLRARDANDAKQWAPLDQPGAAVRIDTSHMSIAEVVDSLVSHIELLAR